MVSFGRVLGNEFKKFFNLKTVLAAIISAAAVFAIFQIVFFANFASVDKKNILDKDKAKSYYQERLAKETEELKYYEDYIELYKNNADFDMEDALENRDNALRDVNYYKLILEEELFEGVVYYYYDKDDYNENVKYAGEPFDADMEEVGQGTYLSNGSLSVFFIGMAVCVLGIYTVSKEKQSGNIKNLYTSPVRRGYFIASKLLVTASLGIIVITFYYLLEMCAVGFALGPDRSIVSDGATTWRSVSVYAYLMKQYAAALPQILLAGALGVLLGTLFNNVVGGGLIGASIILALFITLMICSVTVIGGFKTEWIPFAAGAYGYRYAPFRYSVSYNVRNLTIAIGSGLLYTAVVAAAGIVAAESMRIKK